MADTNKFQPEKRWHFRFSISMLLVLMAMVAGYFSSYRLGWDDLQNDYTGMYVPQSGPWVKAP